MVQALTVTETKNPFLDGLGPIRLVLDWTADSSGNVSLAIASTFATALAAKYACCPQPTKVQGDFRSLETIPGANGDKATNCPTGAYTISILDSYGSDILSGTGTARSASVAEKIVWGSGRQVVDSELTLTIAGAGSGKQGRAIVELEDVGYGKLP